MTHSFLVCNLASAHYNAAISSIVSLKFLSEMTLLLNWFPLFCLPPADKQGKAEINRSSCSSRKQLNNYPMLHWQEKPRKQISKWGKTQEVIKRD